MGICVVTGADRGIGQALCRLLQQRGETVLAVCLESTSTLGDEGVEVAAGIDVTDSESITRLAAQVGHRNIDILINNAGRVLERPFGRLESSRLLGE